MIKDSNNSIFNFFFRKYIFKLLKKHFSNFYFVNDIPVINTLNGLLILPNHFSWWDGFFIYLINELYFKREFKIMMLEEQLKNYPLFKYAGAYSINPGKPISAKESLTYSLELLKSPNNSVVFYPQGEIRQYDDLPLNVNRGCQFLINNMAGNNSILFPSFKLFFTNNKLPAIAVIFNSFTKDELLKQNLSIEHIMNENIKTLNEAVIKNQFTGDFFAGI